MEIKDSGNRREFNTGALRDIEDGKGRMDLLPWAAIMEVSKHCEAGAKKYGEHNVDKGIPTSSFCDSAARHLAKYLEGWDDEPHLLAAAWNLIWALQMTIKNPEMVNTPYKESKKQENGENKKWVKVYIDNDLLCVEGFINRTFNVIDNGKLAFYKGIDKLYHCDYSIIPPTCNKYFTTRFSSVEERYTMFLIEYGKSIFPNCILNIEINLDEFCE